MRVKSGYGRARVDGGWAYRGDGLCRNCLFEFSDGDMERGESICTYTLLLPQHDAHTGDAQLFETELGNKLMQFCCDLDQRQCESGRTLEAIVVLFTGEPICGLRSLEKIHKSHRKEETLLVMFSVTEHSALPIYK